MALQYKHIKPYLVPAGSRSSRLLSYAGLCVGVFLLLASAQLYINIDRLLQEKNPRKEGYDFISVTKTITNENMGQDNRFSLADVEDMKEQPFIKDAAPLLSNQFRAKASAGNVIPFSTDLFLEAIDNSFLDTLPPSFTWQEGQEELPIIFSADFLEMYNVFSVAQGLPQMSAESAGAVSIFIDCYGDLGVKRQFRGRIVGLSDRVNSILVPQNFLTWANRTLGQGGNNDASRVYIKTVDANNPELLSYFDKNGYYVNKDRTKFGRVKQILQAVVAGLGVFSVLIILLAFMLFSFYLQLMIARSKENLQLLLTLGYAPHWLSNKVSGRWISVYAIIIFVALIIVQVVQFILAQNLSLGSESLSPYVHPLVISLAVVLLLVCIWINRKMVRKLLYGL